MIVFFCSMPVKVDAQMVHRVSELNVNSDFSSPIAISSDSADNTLSAVDVMFFQHPLISADEQEGNPLFESREIDAEEFSVSVNDIIAVPGALVNEAIANDYSGYFELPPIDMLSFNVGLSPAIVRFVNEDQERDVRMHMQVKGAVKIGRQLLISDIRVNFDGKNIVGDSQYDRFGYYPSTLMRDHVDGFAWCAEKSNSSFYEACVVGKQLGSTVTDSLMYDMLLDSHTGLIIAPVYDGLLLDVRMTTNHREMGDGSFPLISPLAFFHSDRSKKIKFLGYAFPGINPHAWGQEPDNNFTFMHSPVAKDLYHIRYSNYANPMLLYPIAIESQQIEGKNGFSVLYHNPILNLNAPVLSSVGRPIIYPIREDNIQGKALAWKNALLVKNNDGRDFIPFSESPYMNHYPSGRIVPIAFWKQMHDYNSREFSGQNPNDLFQIRYVGAVDAGMTIYDIATLTDQINGELVQKTIVPGISSNEFGGDNLSISVFDTRNSLQQSNALYLSDSNRDPDLVNHVKLPLILPEQVIIEPSWLGYAPYEITTANLDKNECEDILITWRGKSVIPVDGVPVVGGDLKFKSPQNLSFAPFFTVLYRSPGEKGCEEAIIQSKDYPQAANIALAVDKIKLEIASVTTGKFNDDDWVDIAYGNYRLDDKNAYTTVLYSGGKDAERGDIIFNPNHQYDGTVGAPGYERLRATNKDRFQAFQPENDENVPLDAGILKLSTDSFVDSKQSLVQIMGKPIVLDPIDCSNTPLTAIGAYDAKRAYAYDEKSVERHLHPIYQKGGSLRAPSCNTMEDICQIEYAVKIGQPEIEIMSLPLLASDDICQIGQSDIDDPLKIKITRLIASLCDESADGQSLIPRPEFSSMLTTQCGLLLRSRMGGLLPNTRGDEDNNGFRINRAVRLSEINVAKGKVPKGTREITVIAKLSKKGPGIVPAVRISLCEFRMQNDDELANCSVDADCQNMNQNSRCIDCRCEEFFSEELPIPGAIPAIQNECGNGQLDPGEQCDMNGSAIIRADEFLDCGICTIDCQCFDCDCEDGSCEPPAIISNPIQPSIVDDTGDCEVYAESYSSNDMKEIIEALNQDVRAITGRKDDLYVEPGQMTRVYCHVPNAADLNQALGKGVNLDTGAPFGVLPYAFVQTNGSVLTDVKTSKISLVNIPKLIVPLKKEGPTITPFVMPEFNLSQDDSETDVSLLMDALPMPVTQMSLNEDGVMIVNNMIQHRAAILQIGQMPEFSKIKSAENAIADGSAQAGQAIQYNNIVHYMKLRTRYDYPLDPTRPGYADNLPEGVDIEDTYIENRTLNPTEILEELKLRANTASSAKRSVYEDLPWDTNLNYEITLYQDKYTSDGFPKTENIALPFLAVNLTNNATAGSMNGPGCNCTMTGNHTMQSQLVWLIFGLFVTLAVYRLRRAI